MQAKHHRRSRQQGWLQESGSRLPQSTVLRTYAARGGVPGGACGDAGVQAWRVALTLLCAGSPTAKVSSVHATPMIFTLSFAALGNEDRDESCVSCITA